MRYCHEARSKEKKFARKVHNDARLGNQIESNILIPHDGNRRTGVAPTPLPTRTQRQEEGRRWSQRPEEPAALKRRALPPGAGRGTVEPQPATATPSWRGGAEDGVARR